MSEEIKQNRHRFAASKVIKIASASYADIKVKPFAAALFNGEVARTTDKQGNLLNLSGKVVSKMQVETENVKTATLQEYLANKSLREGKVQTIAQGFAETIQLSDAAKAKIARMSANLNNTLAINKNKTYSV